MIFLGIPTYNWQTDIVAQAVCQRESMERGDLCWFSKGSSLLTFNCNMMWVEALNRRETQKVTHFIMLHSDIRPEQGFVGKMLKIMEEHQAEMISVVSPLKDRSGLTSTGANVKIDGRLWRRRLSMAEVFKLPAVFNASDVARLWELEPECVQLIVNTGLFLINMRAPWIEKVWFAAIDGIIKQDDGKFVCHCESEDWFFSRRVAEEGGKIVATREVKLEHVGNFCYSNQEVLGDSIDQRGLWPGAMK